MNTLTLHRRSPYKSIHTRPLGNDTQNVSFSIGRHKIPFNLSDRAVAIMDEVFKPNRSQWIKQSIAREIQRVDTWRGLAFRAACKLTSEIKSLFVGTPEQKAAEFEAQVKALPNELAQPKPNADALIDDLAKVKADGEYEPTK